MFENTKPVNIYASYFTCLVTFLGAYNNWGDGRPALVAFFLISGVTLFILTTMGLIAYKKRIKKENSVNEDKIEK